MNLKNRKLRFAIFLAAVAVVFGGALWLIFSKPAAADPKTGPVGLNLRLPGAVLARDSSKTKLDYYSFAMADSLKKKEGLSLDPYAKDSTAAVVAGVQARVAEIREQTRRNIVPTETVYRSNKTDSRDENVQASQPAAVASATDPEMAAINATLDKIADLQRPAQNSTTQTTDNGKERLVYTVAEGGTNEGTYFGRHASSATSSRFFGDAFQSGSTGGIRARISGEQQVQSGSTVKLELLTAISVHGNHIPSGTFLFGIAYLDGERLRVQVHSIRNGNLILPVSLQVFDLDGLEGIFIPGSLPREVMKESADQAIQSADVSGGLSLAGRAASAGFGLAKNLFSKKLRQVRVGLCNGYLVLLQDKQQNEVQ